MPDKVVVITGASSGIGASLAELIGKRGASVVLLARREEQLKSVASRAGAHAVPVVADVTRREDVRRAVSAAIERFGRIDVWINNAGRGISRMPSQLTDADIDDMVQVNVKSVLYGTQEVLPHFIERGSGHIINVSSMLGRLPLALFRSAYIGSKHFVNALTACFREELAKYPGIQVSLVSPGVVATDFGLNAVHGGPDSRSLPGAQSAEAVAEVIAGVIDSRQPDVYTQPGSRERVIAYYTSLGIDPPSWPDREP
jgi:NADP-dependent 3-hydroxy acid dehydrogenase YdfG